VAERRLRDEIEDLRREKDELRRMYEKSQRAETVRELEKKHAEDLKAMKAVRKLHLHIQTYTTRRRGRNIKKISKPKKKKPNKKQYRNFKTNCKKQITQ
jgi:hypothetical protein